MSIISNNEKEITGAKRKQFDQPQLLWLEALHKIIQNLTGLDMNEISS
jgi:hypothetical protein